MRSLMIVEEFWASRCAVSWCLRSFGRHGVLPHDVWGVFGVTVHSHDFLRGVWASRCDLMMFEEFRASQCALS